MRYFFMNANFFCFVFIYHYFYIVYFPLNTPCMTKKIIEVEWDIFEDIVMSSLMKKEIIER